MLLISGGLIALALLALIAAFLVARGGTRSIELDRSTGIVQVKLEPSTIPITTPLPILEIEEQKTEKRATVPLFQHQQLTTPSQTEEKLEQLDFPERLIPTYSNINRDTAISDFNPQSGASVSEKWTLESQPYTERDVAALKQQLFELAGQLHLLQHNSRSIEQRVLEVSRALELLDNENSSKSTMSDSSSQISYHG